MSNELLYRIALTQIPQIGDITAKKLLEHFGTAGAVFAAGKGALERLPEIGTARAAAIRHFNAFDRVRQEIRFIEKYKIQPVFYTDDAYPKRLHHCADSPLLLYFKGNANLNASRIVNIVGTRHPSPYGREICRQLVEELAPYDVTIVSGMAYGIDITAHKTALQEKLCTIGVLAHGLDRIYPAAHKHIAGSMLANGGLLTDFTSGTAPDRQNFPKRNRIVAGISDATIVIESGLQGGSLITADIANSYNRDVMTIPGRIGDPHSAGCHQLIKQHRAMLITGAADILETMGWLPAHPSLPVKQRELFITLGPEEQQLVDFFREKPERHIDEIMQQCPIPGSQITSAILNLEMHSLLKSLPGQFYQFVG